MPSILDKSFVYVPAGSTDIRKTFERIREKLQEAHAAGEAARQERQEQSARDLAGVVRIFEQRRRQEKA